MCGAGGSRGRRRRRQGMRCEGYCGAMLSALLTARTPTPGNGHTHEAHARGDARARVDCMVGDRSLRDGGRLAFIFAIGL